MDRLKILTWHVHGSYLNALSRVEHDWYLPVRPDPSEGYGGRAGYDLPGWVQEIDAADVRDLDLDLVIYQSVRNLREDGPELLGDRQRRLPGIYLEHNTPFPDPVNSRHPAANSDLLLVHVTHFNWQMWSSGSTRTTVIEHSVAIDPDAHYEGTLPRGITVVNSMLRRPRIAGMDLFEQARRQIPLDLAGMGSEQLGGLGDIPYRDLHRRIAPFRFLFSPNRYTSLPLAVIEAMTIGMPVVALATTELPSVIRDGVSGYVSCDLDRLVRCMQELIDDPAKARWMGENARAVAEERFGPERFASDWNTAFTQAIALRSALVNSRETTT